MGYSTSYEGDLRFTRELTASELVAVKKWLGEDVRDHDWEHAYKEYGGYWYHIDLELTDDFGGLKWSGAEKTGDLSCIANFLIDRVREDVADFGLSGQMNAQGEDFDDRWSLVFDEDGRAHHRKVTITTGTVVECPHCEEKFVYEGGTVSEGQGDEK